MEKFYCRNDIIEFLYKVKELIADKASNAFSQEDLAYILHALNVSIPLSKYCDSDVKEFCDEVLFEIENTLFWVDDAFHLVEEHPPTIFNSSLVVLH